MDKHELFHQFVAFTAAVHQVTNEMTKDVNAQSITPVQYKILEYLAVSQPVTLSEISECMHISMPNTSRELKKLTEQDLCKKVPDKEDRRKQYVSLSEKGTLMMNEAFGHIQARLDNRLQQLTEEELMEVKRALTLLHQKVFY